MLNPDLQLRTDELYQSTRDGSGEGFLLLGEQNPDVIIMSADLPESTRTLSFAKKFPERFINTGVAEQNMAGIAAGLALSGKIPFISSFAVFSPGRNWDQIRVSICYSKANVKVIASEAGLSVAQDGASHQGMEDIAITRVLPNMTVIAPGDFEETRKAILAAAAMQGPVYIRFCKTNVRTFTSANSPFSIGQAYVYAEGSDVTLFNTGLTLELCMKARDVLESQGIQAEVVHVPTIKPLDEQTVLTSVYKTKCAVTVEDHQIAGGFGSAILETLVQKYPIPVEMIGMRDSFGESGSAEDLFRKYHITVEDIVEKAKLAISRKAS